jgi:hypothetical protein
MISSAREKNDVLQPGHLRRRGRRLADHRLVRGRSRPIHHGVPNSLGDVNNRYWYFYAQNADGSLVWAGPISVYVSNEAFKSLLRHRNYFVVDRRASPA